MIIHTYLRVKMAKKLDDVYICCDTKEVLQVGKKFKAKGLITEKKHKQGGNRICEGYKKLKKKFQIKYVNIELNKKSFQSQSKIYVSKFLYLEKNSC